MAAQLSGIAGGYVYNADDSPPYYPKGNSAILAVVIFNLVIACSSCSFLFPLSCTDEDFRS
jgi:hypothetical protein